MLTATKNTNVDFDRKNHEDEYSRTSYDYDRLYAREAKDTSADYRDHLYDSLQGKRKSRVMGYNEHEDDIRYRSIARDEGYGEDTNFRTRTNDKSEAKTRRVFKKKMIPLIACYFLMVAVVVALIVVNVTGTAWESESIRINPNTAIIPGETASAVVNPTGGVAALNTIVMQNEVVIVSLSPYPTQNAYEEDTNWFDRFCDWISNLVGG